MNNIRKPVFIGIGVVCVVLGLIGIFVPVLPTTPFLLLAAYFFARSSQRALYWIENNRLFGSYIRNYRQGLGMPLWHKLLTLSLLWIAIGASIVFVVESFWVDLILLLIAAGVTFHLTRIKTYQPEA